MTIILTEGQCVLFVIKKNLEGVIVMRLGNYKQ